MSLIRFKITEINPEQHSIVVRFYSDTITEASLATQWSATGEILRCRTDYSIDLPFPIPHVSVIANFISAYAPVQWLLMQEKILDPTIDTSLSEVASLVGVESMVLEPMLSHPFSSPTQDIPQISVATMPVQEPVPVPVPTTT